MFDATESYFATCAKGLEDVLAAELRDPRIGASGVEPGSSGVYFAGNRATGYMANLWLRTGIRVLEESARAEVSGPDDLYDWARTLPWHKMMRLEQTFSVEARVRDSQITHSKYAALRIKDALCDAFRDKKGARPSVDVERADLPLFLYLFRDEAILYRDLSGTTLHKRGYRDAMHKSSLNECLAAGLALMSGWEGEGALCDPMCGSGTLAIEAALAALRRAPGLSRKRFPFETWLDFDKAVWKDCKARAHAESRYELPGRIFANDHHTGALALAKRDAEAAGVAAFIEFNLADVAAYEPPERPRVVLVNPPWGERLQDEDLHGTWRKLGAFLKDRCAGAEAWVFTGNLEAPRELGLTPSKSIAIRHGKVDCRVLKYVLSNS